MDPRSPASDRPQAALPPPALGLVARLEAQLGEERRELLRARRERQAEWDAGALPGPLPAGALPEAAHPDWRVAALPADLNCRRVEITGPVNNRKLVIQMLSRGEDGARADAAMLDFEDSMKPTWPNVIDGLANLAGAARGELVWRQAGEGGEREVRLDPDDMPLLMVRCRGLHLAESNVTLGGRPVAAGIFDLALGAWHAAGALRERGRTPKFYVPKCEHHLEAAWWNRVFRGIEEGLELERGTLRATFLVETLPAAFQMEEILWQIRERAAGLNVGRWDKIFSDIKCLAEHSDRVLADRATIGLERPWMRAYAERLVAICHRRGAHAIGGMAAFTPGKSAERRAEQRAKVLADKRFEADLGHDGCWVSHPFFIAPALEAFGRPHQLDRLPEPPPAASLLPHGSGPRTLAGLRTNLRAGIAYLRGWRAGIGCIAWDDLMEDLATLEIARAQTWQWLRHGVALDDGPVVDRPLVAAILERELERILGEAPPAEHDDWRAAAVDVEALFCAAELRPFLAEASEASAAGVRIDHASTKEAVPWATTR